MSKSTAPDLATRTHEDISHGLYECPICTAEVLRNSKIWSCKTCWTVFHLSCIKRWSKNEGSAQQQQPNQEGELPPARQWRCPGCNLPKDEMPTAYTCWCAKEIDPKPIPGIPPHSCGQTCSKLRAPRKCPHPCDLLCHAGPCPPCPHTGPALACYCGKEAAARRCIETDYDNGWSCGKICGDLMPCGEHHCERGCHEGLCGSCEVLVDSRCYCGKVEKSLPCSEREEQRESNLPFTIVEPDMHDTTNTQTAERQLQDDDSTTDEVHRTLEKQVTIDTWVGSFDCGTKCGRMFDCNKHSCEQSCHEQEISTPHCPFSPDVVSHCPCGKTSMKDMNCLRRSCDDPIPHCEEKCQRPLPCAHLCQQKCHSGECMPCLETVSIKCRCGRTSSSTICHQGSEQLPQCARTCRTLLNCGRHECPERCCPGEKIAAERQVAKRKLKSLSTASHEDIEAEHICTRTCGRQLKCGNPEHICQELCHRGPCSSCREAIFDEISCRCGRTVLQPPLACGTQPPACQYQCDRPKACGHPQVQHQCHIDDSCPKCPYLVQKACMCGKSMLKNQPCWSNSISCGQTCGRRLRCGIHFCQKSCHRPGECEDAGSSCPHPCGQKKTAPGCGHVCLDPCHAPYPCKEDKPCQAKMIITCECQNKKQEIKCLATKSGETNEERRTLPCDDECLRLQRNHKLAVALNISHDHMDDHIPYSSTTLDMFKDNVKWCQTQEREFRVFAADDSEKRLRFKPMPPNQRAFLHSLAEDFGLDSESMDPEPHRHVAIFKTPRFVSAPMKTLSQCIKIRSAAQPSIVSVFTAEVTEPYNALILAFPRFALTTDELRSHLRTDLSSAPNFTFNISFLPSEEIVIYPDHSSKDDTTEAMLRQLKPLVAKSITTNLLADSVALCRVDHSLNVIRREDDMKAAGGWSQVVKGAPFKSARFDSTVGSKSSFTVLGTKLGSSKPKKEVENVVENWESAMDDWQ
jgi:transcriptional repressor NF-X1